MKVNIGIFILGLLLFEFQCISGDNGSITKLQAFFVVFLGLR